MRCTRLALAGVRVIGCGVLLVSPLGSGGGYTESRPDTNTHLIIMVAGSRNVDPLSKGSYLRRGQGEEGRVTVRWGGGETSWTVEGSTLLWSGAAAHHWMWALMALMGLMGLMLMGSMHGQAGTSPPGPEVVVLPLSLFSIDQTRE